MNDRYHKQPRAIHISSASMHSVMTTIGEAMCEAQALHSRVSHDLEWLVYGMHALWENHDQARPEIESIIDQIKAIGERIDDDFAPSDLPEPEDND